MKLNEQMTTKKEWSAPSLTIYGNVETITQGCDKKFGGSDGFTFQSIDIQCAS